MSQATLVDAPGAVRRPHHASVDGLKGVAIVLLVAYHWNVIWPRQTAIQALGSLGSLVQAGNIAVTLFFAISGYLVTLGLLDASARRRVLGPLLYFERRTLRIAAQLLLLLTTVLIVWRFDATDTASRRATLRSMTSAATFTYNRFVATDPFSARADLGHLYLLSIDVQYFAVLALAIVAIGRRYRALGYTILAVLLFVLWWRWRLFLDVGWFQAALATSARADGLLAGSIVAVISRGGPPLAARHRWPALAGAMSLLLLGAVVSCSFLGIDAYFGLQGAVVAIAAAIFVGGLTSAGSETGLAARGLAWRPLARLGRASLTIFLWHMPILHLISRHYGDRGPAAQTILALTLLIVVSILVERVAVPAAARALDWVFARRMLARLK